MAFVRVLTALLKDKKIGKNIYCQLFLTKPVLFGMEGLFRQVGIYAHEGQNTYRKTLTKWLIIVKIKPVKYCKKGLTNSVLCLHGYRQRQLLSQRYTYDPFYIYYSMFGFQRIGDMAWAAGDMRARGFLVGGTSGRTTLNGEGLQHQDGHSHVLANTILTVFLTIQPTVTKLPLWYKMVFVVCTARIKKISSTT